MLSFVSVVHAQPDTYYTVDVSVQRDVVTTISPLIWGSNAEALPELTADQFLATYPAFRTMGIKLIRYPGGCASDGYDWKNNVVSYESAGGVMNIVRMMSVDEVLKLAEIIGAKIIYVVDIGNQDGYGMGCGTEVMHYPDSWDTNLELFYKYKGRISYYQLGNEPWMWRKLTTPTTYYPVENYLTTAIKYAEIIKQIDPAVKTTLVSHPTYENGLLSSLTRICGNAPCFDSVSVHPYYSEGYDPTQPVTADNFPGKSAFSVFTYNNPYYSHLNEFFQLNSAGVNKSLALTEYNLICWGQSKKIGIVDHGMYMFEHLFQMISHNVSIANYYDMLHTQILDRTGNCGMLEEDNSTVTAVAQTFTLSSIAAGGRLFNTTNNSPTISTGSVEVPYLSSYSLIGEDGLIYVFLSNKHPTNGAAVNVQFNPSVEGLASVNTAIITLLSSDSFAARAFNSSTYEVLFSNPLSLTVPPHAIMRVKLFNSNAGPFSCNRCSAIHGCERTQFQAPTDACGVPNSGVIRTTDCACPQVSGGDNTRCTPSCNAPPAVTTRDFFPWYIGYSTSKSGIGYVILRKQW
jgi:alpha-L-arabinofuranosidase